MQDFPIMPGMGDNQEAQRLYERMQADMQKINNAANFARQTLFSAVDAQAKTSVTETSNMLDSGDAYLRLFASAMDFGLKMEGIIENRVAKLAREYENNPAIHVPDAPKIIRPH